MVFVLCVYWSKTFPAVIYTCFYFLASKLLEKDLVLYFFTFISPDLITYVEKSIWYLLVNLACAYSFIWILQLQCRLRGKLDSNGCVGAFLEERVNMGVNFILSAEVSIKLYTCAVFLHDIRSFESHNHPNGLHRLITQRKTTSSGLAWQ